MKTGSCNYQDEIHGPLSSQAHRATEIFFNKYLKGLADIKDNIGINIGSDAEDSADDRYEIIVTFCVEAKSKAEI